MAEQLNRTQRRRAERQVKKDTRVKERQKQHAVSTAQKAIVFAIAALFLAGAGYWGYSRWKEGSPGQFVPSMGNRHVDPSEVGLTKYNSDPPSSGPHTGQLANWGIHSEPIPKEFEVHNLEDGGVVMQYNCPATEAGCKDLIDKLSAIARRYKDSIILAPYPGMSNKIALTAWTRIDKFDQFDEQRIVRFIEAYIHIDHHPAGGEG
ncbi:MAG TPA: DUF3105 domain-containing protein [Verrucomicrobiae bacterium]|jgi:hypothetical protein|nr:DUF3105 domain-containing protein [Verrucomicrobiae bacterium]